MCLVWSSDVRCSLHWYVHLRPGASRCGPADPQTTQHTSKSPTSLSNSGSLVAPPPSKRSSSLIVSICELTPLRSSSWPSYLDNTVAGGITSRATPFSSIVRECAEEASLPESLTESLLRSVSLLSYTYRTPTGWVQPEIQYLYDLKLPPGVEPRTNVDDGEVESFMLMEVEEVVERMCKGEFKPNCAIVSSPVYPLSPSPFGLGLSADVLVLRGWAQVLIDFFIRHGYLTPESDSRYLEVATRLRRPLVLPGPI